MPANYSNQGLPDLRHHRANHGSSFDEAKDQILVLQDCRNMIFIFAFILTFGKQILKIYNNSSQTMWPNIYTFNNENKIYKKTIVNIGDNFIYYLANNGDGLCMYSTPPCTSYPISEIKYKKKYTYSILSWKD